MRLLNKKQLLKLKQKNKGNKPLSNAIDKLVADIIENNWKNPTEVIMKRKDADCIHPDGFYFFNISMHRTMVLLAFEEGEASVVWAGTHKEYENVFRNNRKTIKKWLRANNWI